MRDLPWIIHYRTASGGQIRTGALTKEAAINRALELIADGAEVQSIDGPDGPLRPEDIVAPRQKRKKSRPIPKA